MGDYVGREGKRSRSLARSKDGEGEIERFQERDWSAGDLASARFLEKGLYYAGREAASPANRPGETPECAFLLRARTTLPRFSFFFRERRTRRAKRSTRNV
ncbi:hypothetical protein MRX96_027091 [Rhipicephalus microplus]